MASTVGMKSNGDGETVNVYNTDSIVTCIVSGLFLHHRLQYHGNPTKTHHRRKTGNDLVWHLRSLKVLHLCKYKLTKLSSNMTVTISQWLFVSIQNIKSKTACITVIFCV